MHWDLPDPFIRERVAAPDEIDGYGHVNNAVYVAWLDDCAWAHSTALTISPEVCTRLNRGMAVWRTQINYIGAALEGDPAHVRHAVLLDPNASATLSPEAISELVDAMIEAHGDALPAGIRSGS